MPMQYFKLTKTRNYYKMLKLNNIKQLQTLIRVISIPQGSYLTSTNSVTDCIKQLTPTQVLAQHRRRISVTAPVEKKSKSSKQDLESDSEYEDDAEFKDERDSKVVKTNVNSLRADLLLKAGLGIARNKIENIFYESRIRVNGKKLLKKSVQLNQDDEIDVIRGFSQTNPSHLVVSRVVILSAAAREEGLKVHLRRYKSLLVENYRGVDAFKSSAASDH